MKRGIEDIFEGLTQNAAQKKKKVENIKKDKENEEESVF